MDDKKKAAAILIGRIYQLSVFIIVAILTQLQYSSFLLFNLGCYVHVHNMTFDKSVAVIKILLTLP